MQKNETFEQYYQSQADEAASLLIYKTLAVSEPQVKLAAWRHDPQNFPHFTAYLKNSIFGMYDAERHPNARLDPNWLDDVEQLCFLVDDCLCGRESGLFQCLAGGGTGTHEDCDGQGGEAPRAGHLRRGIRGRWRRSGDGG